jgi:thiamine monophosphate kinase
MLSKAFSVAAVIAAFGAMGGTAQAMTISLGAPTLSVSTIIGDPQLRS